MSNQQEGSIYMNDMGQVLLHILQVPPDRELYRLFKQLRRDIRWRILSSEINAQTSHSFKMIPGKDEKRSIDNLGMPGNFKYVNVQLLN